MSRNEAFMYISDERLSNFAENTAREFTDIYLSKCGRTASRLRSALKSVGACREKQRLAFTDASTVPAEIEWLLDNWYIAVREGFDTLLVFRRAEKIRHSRKTRLPLILDAASALVHAGKAEINENRLYIFLESFQNVLPFSEMELALFIPAVKAALVFELEKLCAEIGTRKIPDEKHKELTQKMKNIFSSLRLLGDMEVSDLLENVSRVEKILRRDPSGEYALMDEKTRAYYRRAVSKLAKKRGTTEQEEALRAIERATKTRKGRKHVGHFIVPAAYAKKKGGAYIAFLTLATLFVSLLVGFLCENALAAVLTVVPVWTAVKNSADYFIVRLTAPDVIPAMELENGIPDDARTLCVVSTLLTSAETGEETARKIEGYMLANRDAGENLSFGILADLPEADEAEKKEDGAKIAAAKRAVEALNEKYGNRFLLFVRARTYSRSDGKFMAWERKRGAILELVRLVKGIGGSIRCEAGDCAVLPAVKYLIVLDSDTKLTVSSARELVGAMLHPLNRAVVGHGRVIRGHGIMQPRVTVDLESSNASDFARVFAGLGGLDAYGGASSDLYQDLFGKGTFTGKGIIDVDAYFQCLNERFPENRILSHDLLEGEYLGCAYLSTTELLDGFPSGVRPYFERAHRWVRGDWQAAVWMFGRVRNGRGEKCRNTLGSVSRLKIFDNLMRSLAPVFIFAVLAVSAITTSKAFAVAAAVSLVCALSNLLLSSAEMVVRHGPGTRVRYHSTVISGFAGALLQTMIRLMLLPYKAYVSASAVVTALFRMLVSHRGLLNWVTAAESESRKKDTILNTCLTMLPQMLAGLVIALFSPHPVGCASGIVWLFSPFFAWSLSRKRENAVSVPESDRKLLTDCAADIWRYFTDFVNAENNYLPPDNWQEQPANGLARRTSPTNIGLALLAPLCAMDLGLCEESFAVEMMSKTTETVEKLEKWHGNLFNWYDTETVQPLSPRYVSTVDSGNFAGCVIAAVSALEAMSCPGAGETAARLKNILDQTELKALFDEKKKLFRIGVNTEKTEASDGWYDLLSSEARQTSYIAVARGEAGRKHWRRLGRMLVSQDNYRGTVSWTGTMFEYMMPNLLLPCCRNSLLYESAKFCLYAQKKAVPKGLPWGISESAFFAFDSSMNYMYKAHGAQRLALKRDMDRELVISPYSSFLTLGTDFSAAVRNIRALKKLSLEGRYGFYEAADFTGSRVTAEKYEKVRTFMAHHLGMSLCAIDNALCGNVLQKRFMQNREMAAHAELLQERVPVGQRPVRLQKRDVPEKPVNSRAGGFSLRLSGVDGKRPFCAILSNGAYSTLFAENGMTRSVFRGYLVKRFDGGLFGAGGMNLYIRAGDWLTPLLPFEGSDGKTAFRSFFSAAKCGIEAENESVLAETSVFIPGTEMGEIWTVRLKNRGNAPLQGSLIAFFEPVLTSPADYFAHPGFTKVKMTAQKSEERILITRRGDGKKKQASLCFMPDHRAKTAVSRLDVFDRGRLRKSVLGGESTKAEPLVYAENEFTLSPDGEMIFRFALAVGAESAECEAAAKRMLEKRENALPLADIVSAKLGIADPAGAFELLSPLIFREARSVRPGVTDLSGGVRALWRFGISGDLPIAFGVLSNETQLEKLGDALKRARLIRDCGFDFDLVVLVREEDGYRKPLFSAAETAARKLGFEGGAGVTVLQNAEAEAALRANAALELDFDSMEPKTPVRDTDSIVFLKLPELSDGSTELEFSFAETGDFCFKGLPRRCFALPLANESFGYLATDAGTGHLWYGNSREFKLTPWLNDAVTETGCESMKVVDKNIRFSLFGERCGENTAITYGKGYAVWEKTVNGRHVRTTVFVPPKLNARVLIAETDGLTDGAELHYHADLLLGSDTRDARFVITAAENGCLSAENPAAQGFENTRFTLCSNMEMRAFTCDETSYRENRFDGRVGNANDPCFAAVFRMKKVSILVCGCEEPETLKALCKAENAYSLLKETVQFWEELTGGIRVKTPSAKLNHYLNGWALYQTYACRMLARTSVYQCGGAYGFRDQLQDVCALTETVPEKCAEHILRCCAHQFEEGDVLHWWHPSSAGDRGVRTRCSDDLLWLPYALCVYVEKTGDISFCRREAAFLSAPPLENGEKERYEVFDVSEKSASVFSHAQVAVEAALSRGFGSHGLMLIGSGDWNDGFDRVGAKGRGESVWLTWFTALVCGRFADLCERLGETERAQEYKAAAEKCLSAAEDAFNEKWFLRGWYDSGEPLGSMDSDACEIDSLSQSFAVFAGCRDKTKQRTALESAVSALYDRGKGVVRLFTPAFDETEADPGYVKSYAPGFRENGGQYTHAAIWLAGACLLGGAEEDGADMLLDLLPEDKAPEVYAAEPFVLAGDVYYAPGCEGMAGWSWYTGAAGWYYRTAIELLLGIRLCGEGLTLCPHIPRSWSGFEADVRCFGKSVHIEVIRGEDSALLIDGRPYADKNVPKSVLMASKVIRFTINS